MPLSLVARTLCFLVACFTANTMHMQLRGIKFDQDDVLGFPYDGAVQRNVFPDFALCNEFYATKYYRVADSNMECHETCLPEIVAALYRLLYFKFVPAPVPYICEQMGFPVFLMTRAKDHFLSIVPEYDVYGIDAAEQ